MANQAAGVGSFIVCRNGGLGGKGGRNGANRARIEVADQAARPGGAPAGALGVHGEGAAVVARGNGRSGLERVLDGGGTGRTAGKSSRIGAGGVSRRHGNGGVSARDGRGGAGARGGGLGIVDRRCVEAATESARCCRGSAVGGDGKRRCLGVVCRARGAYAVRDVARPVERGGMGIAHQPAGVHGEVSARIRGGKGERGDGRTVGRSKGNAVVGESDGVCRAHQSADGEHAVAPGPAHVEVDRSGDTCRIPTCGLLGAQIDRAAFDVGIARFPHEQAGGNRRSGGKVDRAFGGNGSVRNRAAFYGAEDARARCRGPILYLSLGEAGLEIGAARKIDARLEYGVGCARCKRAFCGLQVLRGRCAAAVARAVGVGEAALRPRRVGFGECAYERAFEGSIDGPIGARKSDWLPRAGNRDVVGLEEGLVGAKVCGRVDAVYRRADVLQLFGRAHLVGGG